MDTPHVPEHPLAAGASRNYLETPPKIQNRIRTEQNPGFHSSRAFPSAQRGKGHMELPALEIQCVKSSGVGV